MKKIVTLLFLCAAHLALAQTETQLQNIETFNRLYGYIKYFHPSDEAASLDWDKFAIHGSREVEKCSNSSELQATLLRLFLPVAPTIKVIMENEDPSFPLTALVPADTNGFKVVTWQHTGLGSGNPQSPYISSRTNRKSIVTPSGTFSSITSSADMSQYRGREFKLTGSIRLSEGPGSAHLWARVDKTDRKKGFFDNMENRPVTASGWNTYEINGKIDSDAVKLVFGCFLKSRGKLVVDNLILSIREGENWKVIYTNSFESDNLNDSPQSISAAKVPGFKISVSGENASDGKKSILIESIVSETEHGLLFERYCRVGDHVKKDIGAGLTVIIPLAVYGNETLTFPQADAEKLPLLKDQLKNISPDPEMDIHSRTGDIIIAWNVFQHFYPYFDVTKTDWNSAFRSAIKEAYTNTSAYDFQKTLQRLTAQLKDGHVRVSSPTTAINEAFTLPLQWEWIEKKLVITKVMDGNLSLKTGDIVTAIDNVPADVYFRDVSQYISAASPGWLNHRAQTASLQGPGHSKVTLDLLDAKHQKKHVSLTRSLSMQEYYNQLKDDRREPVRKITEGIYYINISKASMQQIRSQMQDLQDAKALICDLRGYPNSNHELIGHFLQQSDTSGSWMLVPQIIYPDQENITGYRNFGWEMKPLKPHIRAKVFFLVDGRAISYAESFMSFIEHYDLATIIGQPSAGTNGNVNTFQLPGSYRVSWTGMKVLKHDGSQLHGIGILPDIYVEKTIAGVRENKDEFLDKAIELATQFQMNMQD